MTRAELVRFEGTSRTVLEARIRALVAVLDALALRFDDRAQNAARTAALHGDADVRIDAGARCGAYCVARDDVHDLFESAECP